MVAVIGVAGRHAVLLGLSVAEDEDQVGAHFCLSMLAGTVRPRWLVDS